MSANIALKLTTDVYDVGFNWLECDALEDGETITASEWELLFGAITTNISGSQVDDLPGNSFDDDETKIWFKGGQQGTTSKLKNTVTTSLGRTLNDVIIVTILDFLDPNLKIPDSRRFRLIPTESGGLRGEIAKSFSIGIPTTIAVDFVEDLPVYGRVVSVDMLSIQAGAGGGLAFASAAPFQTVGKLKLTPQIAGQYTVRVKVTFENPLGEPDQSQGDIVINAAA